MSKKHSIQSISVIVPGNPFVSRSLQGTRHCLTALNVEKLMEWWPGTPHTPHRNPTKVRAIQRSLDWKRVAQIAAYLLQKEIIEAPDQIDKYFRPIYEPKKTDPGRQWPPKVSRVVGFERSEFPTFSNVLLHVNGATVNPMKPTRGAGAGAAKLVFDEQDTKLCFSVIDGQHRINGAYLAVRILREDTPNAKWEIPSEIFLDLDAIDAPPRRQAQIFIDVNFYQKKVDRSLVADLFPTARGERGPLDDTERSQDLGRKLMLEVGPLVGLVQIPGIRFGVKDVVTLATLTSAVEDVLDPMRRSKVESLEAQAEFLAQCLDAWLEATGRREEVAGTDGLDPENVAYQGRVIVSFLTLLPACLWKIREEGAPLVSEKAATMLTRWLREVMKRAGLLENSRFLPRSKFQQKGFLGSGGLARFRDTLWGAALASRSVNKMKPEKLAELAMRNRATIQQAMES